ncbi:hypothetical protein CLAIMM_00309, partial [Cladophialophora immunda]
MGGRMYLIVADGSGEWILYLAALVEIAVRHLWMTGTRQSHGQPPSAQSMDTDPEPGMGRRREQNIKGTMGRPNSPSVPVARCIFHRLSPMEGVDRIADNGAWFSWGARERMGKRCVVWSNLTTKKKP